MGDLRETAPALCITAAFSRHDTALAWARSRLEAAWGPIVLESDVFAFTDTDYYQPTMGPELKKCFWAFEERIDPAELPARKHQANAWEAEYAQAADHAEPRPLNLDPGYLTSAKLVLASTKDHAHRLYLADGIYGEVTLCFRDGRWQQAGWTFPDYRREDYQAFFTLCRNHLRRQERRERRT